MKLIRERTSQRVHSERLATIRRLASAVAHEIKNPLFYISGNTEIIEDSIKTGHIGEAHKNLDKIKDGVSRIERLVKSLNSYSRKDSEKKLFCSVRDIVENAVVILTHRLKKGYTTLVYSEITEDLINNASMS